jgi:hypothetical protein
MGSFADFEDLLARCAVVRREHEETKETLQSLPESEVKRVLMAEFEASFRRTTESERLAREAYNRERAKLN